MSALDHFRLDRRIAVVTGGGLGLGRATALAFAEAGADVVVAARRKVTIDNVAREVSDRGRSALAFSADLRDPEAPARLVKATLERFGRIDIWVNNAGGADDRGAYAVADTTPEHWDDVVDLNLKGTWRCCREAAPAISDGGAIVNMSSIMAFQGGKGYAPYSASKAGINALTRVLALELAARNIRVNAVAPGPVPTESFQGAPGNQADPKEVARRRGVALGRLGDPQDVALACLFLASPAASWVTGQTLIVAGGM